ATNCPFRLESFSFLPSCIDISTSGAASPSATLPAGAEVVDALEDDAVSALGGGAFLSQAARARTANSETTRSFMAETLAQFRSFQRVAVKLPTRAFLP